MAWGAAKWRAVVLDFLERAGWSAGEVFFATLLAGGTTVSVANLPWAYSLTLAFSAAVSSIVLTAVQYLAKQTNLSFWPDLLVRMVKTFLGSLSASIAAAKVFDLTTFHWSAALNVAVLATLTALGKGLLARQSVVQVVQVVPAAAPAASAAASAAPIERAAPAAPAATATVREATPPEVAAAPVPAAQANPSTLPTQTYVEAVQQ
ncbi:hypothetical protein ODJ79_05005 [Actinoplanes sp. KI2]|uniref:hypothetical protein n=1 Tax=Actinoplanes sp. KI2 TaxID=2983315 RepID=UPI0021D5E5B4|nr:hypothetical protein [Actinoplanes sp. KI2]MCU7723065.1 hypothetical protein [Actinoplanes sp. KI2]